MKKTFRICLCLLLTLGLCLGLASIAFADSPTDEILNYEIVADVNDDASVRLQYHLEWKVLESDGIGPVEWVSIGIPNGNITEITPVTDNISSAAYDTSSGNNVRIDFNQSYYEDEVISFDFVITADYLYQMNAIEDEHSVYYFTPGWFDGIAVDRLCISWSAANASSWSGGALQKGDYLVWETRLGAGETYSIEVSYPNDAYAFNQASNEYQSGSYSDDYYYDDGNYYDDGYYHSPFRGIFSLLPMIPFISFAVFFVLAIKNAKKNYEKSAGFASGETQTRVTRTKVVYYDSCPGCGAPREENKEICDFCGRSLIKSEEVIKEEEIPDEDKDALKYDKKGLYHFGTDPNTFVRVNVVHVPVFVPHTTNSSGGRGSGGGRPSCAHSSCACACVSCACACACACAGGGRAGCSTKDFYSSKLKLTQLKRKEKNN